MRDFLKRLPNEVAYLHKEVKHMILENMEEEEILLILSKDGISKDYAIQIMENVLSDIRDKKDFFKLLIMSFCTIISALFLNYLLNNQAYKSGIGIMLVFWGLVVAGIIMFIQAIGIYNRMGKY